MDLIRRSPALLALLTATTLVSGITAGVGLAAAPLAAPAACPAPLTATSHASPAGGAPFTICSGRMPSFDGTPLDVDLSVPDAGAGPRPLMVMLHGWGSSKSDFESPTLDGNGANTFHWNNAWFASQGYAVLNYTARGFHRSCGQDQASGYTYLTDPACAGKASWTHLADRRWEIHDTQHLVGALVDDKLADPRKIATTGDSYGGGQSWLLALAQDQILLPDGTTTPWRSARGTPVRLAAAVPQYPWTDLAQALVDNGRASDGFFGAPADGPHETPFGVAKQSYLSGLFALGASTAQYAAPGADPTADLPGWNTAIFAGEPYAQNPVAAAALAQIEQYRSPFSLPVPQGGAQVPVFDLQGTTDPLFPAIQAIELANRLTTAAPNYPLRTFLGDIGHSYASNPPQVWETANTAANTFLAQAMSGSALTQPRYTVTTTACAPGQSTAASSADTIPALATGTLEFAATDTKTTSSAAEPGPEAVRADPLAGNAVPGQPSSAGCPRMTTQTDPGVAAWQFTPANSGTLIGSPVVHLNTQLSGSDAELAARLWDVDPATGTQSLISRSVYRLSSSTATSTQAPAFELWPVAWQVLAGHQLKLELTQVDSPTWRADNLGSALQLSGLRLTLPYHS